MSKNIVFEGWLTKSPPTKRIWRTKWRRRWFALRQSDELPGQYFLDYYADRNCRRLKGTINLDLCEQVDAGLHMERTNNGTMDRKLRGSVFTIQTQQRTYHLEADSEADMEKWVDAICRVCGLRATDDSHNVLDTFSNNISTMSAVREQYECDSTGPYIPISECITGARAQAFTFDPKNMVVNARALERAGAGAGDGHAQMYTSQPHIRLQAADCSENDSNLSDEECKSLNASQSNIRDWSVAKTFTKLAINPKINIIQGPLIPPPRPPKTFLKESFQGPKIEEPVEVHDSYAQYCNLPSLPPAVDRALKPRHSSVGHVNHLLGQTRLQLRHHEDMKTDVLQYLDLDLHSSKAAPSKPKETVPKIKMEVFHGKTQSALEADCAYKTVDFLKTEAFNITRQDAEASRSNHQ